MATPEQAIEHAIALAQAAFEALDRDCFSASKIFAHDVLPQLSASAEWLLEVEAPVYYRCIPTKYQPLSVAGSLAAGGRFNVGGSQIAGPHVEIFRHLERIAVHARVVGITRGVYRHKDEHLPPSHLAMKEATPALIMANAEQIGPATGTIITNLFTKSRHPLMLLRRAQGIVRLGNRYSNKALEDACAIIVGLDIEMPRLADVEEIITNEKARAHMTAATAVKRQPNPHLRGQDTWSKIIH